MSESEPFKPHSLKQERIIFSDADLTIAATGTQFGKSMSAALWFKRQIHLHTNPTDNFLLLAPTYPIMQQSALPYFLRAMEGWGTHNGTAREFRLHSGGVVYIRTETDPDSIVGVPNVRAYWLDEAGKARLYFWENLRARAASKGAKGLLTTSPYSRNWLYRDYIKPKLAGGLSHIELIQAASWENPYHTLHDPVKRRQERESMDPRRFDMIFGGEWGQMVGLVYDCWDDDLNYVDEFTLPHGTKFYGGIDWGYYPDPFVVQVRAVTPDGRHYGVSEFSKVQLTIKDIIEVLKSKRQIFNISVFYCDPSQPGYIEELNRAGLPAVGADNDIRRGVDVHYELIKSRRYKEFKGAMVLAAEERELYHYPEPKDLKDDQGSKELLPVDKDNHAMDCSRYLSLMTYRNDAAKLTPRAHDDKPQEETLEQRFKRLRRVKNSHRGAESWS
jgi:hypothetical protein